MARTPPAYVPQLATLVKEAQQGDAWLHELKYDGYRIGCRIDRGRVQLLTRRGNDWTAAFPEVARAVAALGVTSALFDGEVAVVMPDGRTSFQALQNASAGDARGNLVYFVFDLLHFDGELLTGLTLEERKARLHDVLGRPGARAVVRYSDHVVGGGVAFFENACRLGLEGIISKQRAGTYRPGRHPSWVKTKCVNRQEFVIGGFTDPEGAREGIGALLVGYYDDGKLTFSGKVGTGFTQQSARDLRKRLNAIEQKTAPFDPVPKGPLGRNAHWVQPHLVTEVAFAEWTTEGKIRHPSFQGLRADKPAREVKRERPAAPTPSASTKTRSRARAASADAGNGGEGPAEAGRHKSGDIVAGVRISHPERVMFPDAGITKLQLAQFYERIADWIMPHVDGRPLTLVRCPDGVSGECFYMKHSKIWAPEGIRRVKIKEKTKIGEYLIVESTQALVGLVQMNVIELHTWNSTGDRVETPDRIVFDIDPGEEVRWLQVMQTARMIRDLLATIGLESFVKTTGGRGLHVVVPLAPRADWSDCLEFSRALAEAIVAQAPDTYTTTFAKRGRERKLLIDYLRNNRTNTSVAAFSTRAKPSATISTPLAWAELTRSCTPDTFTVHTLERRLARLDQDPWKDYWASRQRLTKPLLKAVRSIASRGLR